MQVVPSTTRCQQKRASVRWVDDTEFAAIPLLSYGRPDFMQTKQKALIVRTSPDGDVGLDELNIELERGWTVAEVAPMGGAGGATASPCIAALVILESRDDDTPGPTPVSAVEEVEQEADDVVEEVVEEVDESVEGDGANPPGLSVTPSTPDAGSD